ncbi:peptide chain release factor N(5)-glutamine methyltransferase [Mucilaginibacter sp. L196]|uniref:peptide chain release factor N(5)-glutamine methyltransferase n=1 Tax=Mucilaginibacter sp. L196 TaxID=1641870 RepID=UPI00131CA76B|nr:peptide chain release factor N(5)-glutamine methyltransferase [Mucilaginibacter sp. L196]
MKTIKDVFTVFKRRLGDVYDANETEALTLLVVNEISDLSKAQIKAFPEKEITVGQAESLNRIVIRLQTGEPVQYILGHTEFYGLPFKVNPSVLIPRPETEELVEWVLTSVDSSSLTDYNILDIGTGSGCIAISLKKNLPNASVSAIDISIGALETAKQNADLNKVKVDFIQDDILNSKFKIQNSKISGENNQRFEVIISNPPYVTLYDKTQMHNNVTDFEPHSALFVPEDDPLIFYKAIADFALTHLTASGLLFLEINESLGNETVELLQAKGFNSIELRKDMSGRDRMIRGIRF